MAQIGMNHRASNRTHTDFLIRLIPVLSISTYFKVLPATLPGVFILIILLALTVSSTQASHYRYASKAFFLFAFAIQIYIVLGLVPIFWAPSGITVILGGLRYFVLIILLTLSLPRIFGHIDSFIASAATFMAFCIILAITASLIGNFSILPGIVVTRYLPTSLFGYQYYSASGLYLNTNYFGITSFLCLIMTQTVVGQSSSFLRVGNRNQFLWKLIVPTLLFSGILISGSRSAVGLALLWLMFWVVFVQRSSRMRKIFLFTLGALVPAMLIANIDTVGQVVESLVYGDNSRFFLASGLDGRELRYFAAFVAFEANPGGYGFVAVGDAMLAHGSRGPSAQNTFLTYLLIGGYPLFFFSIGMISAAILGFCIRLRDLKSDCLYNVDIRAGFLAIGFGSGLVLADGLFRTYMIGGVGLMPFVLTMTFCASFMLTPKKISKIRIG